MNIKEWITQATQTLTGSGIASAETDATLLAAHVKGVTFARAQTLAVMGSDYEGANLDEDELLLANRLLEERASRVPLQHLTGKAPFRNIELNVGPGVFTPRPETEIVTQYAIDELHNDASPEPYALDLCTGSAAIALAIADEVPNARVFAVEEDTLAHAWAERNVAALGDNRVTLLNADATISNPELTKLNGRFSVVISNPPYVPEDAVPIDPEVREHDPAKALYGGGDGLSVIRSLSKIAKPLVRPGGLFVLEHAEHQGASVREILTRDGWQNPSTHQDLTRRDRVTIARA